MIGPRLGNCHSERSKQLLRRHDDFRRSPHRRYHEPPTRHHQQLGVGIFPNHQRHLLGEYHWQRVADQKRQRQGDSQRDKFLLGRNVGAGTIQIGFGGSTGSLSTSSTIINNDTLVFNRSNSVTQSTDFADEISGTGNVVQSGSGLLILSGNNTNTGTTTLTSGTLTLNGTSTTVAGLAFSGNYSGLVDNLTLSNNSIIDLGEGSVSIMFDTIVMSTYMLDIYNWTGTTLWNGGTGNDTDKVYFGDDLSDAALAKIRFHSGAVGVGDSFLGSGYDLGFQATSWDPGLSGYHIIPVPEPETWATGLLLVLGSGVWLWRKRSRFSTQRMEGAAPSAP